MHRLGAPLRSLRHVTFCPLGGDILSPRSSSVSGGSHDVRRHAADPRRRQPCDGAVRLPRRPHRPRPAPTASGGGPWRVRPLLDMRRGGAARRSDPAVAGRAEERLLDDKGWLAMGAFDPDRAQPRSRPVRLRRSARVRHLRRGDVHGQATSTSSTRAARPTTAPWPTSARTTPRLLPGRVRPARSIRSAPLALLTEAIDAGCAAIHGPVDRRRRPVADAPRPRPFWSTAERQSDVPVRPARRRRRPPARPGVPQQRHAGHRPPRRRREHPLEGLPRHQQLAVALPRRAHPRRPVRPVPEPAWRGASRRVRAGSCRGCTSSTSPSGPSAAPRRRSRTLAMTAVRVRPPAPQVHAVPR